MAAARSGRTIALLLAGILIDVCAVVNVPGAVELPVGDGGDVSVTGWGGALCLLVIVAWASVVRRERHPLAVLIAGGALAVIGVSYLLLLVGAAAIVRRRPAWLGPIATAVGAAVLGFVLREVFGPWGGATEWFFGSSASGEAVWSLVSWIFAVVSFAVTAAIVFAARSRQRAVQSDVRADAEERRAEALAEQTVRQAERERIARDMHDALAHRLSVVSLHAGALETSADGAAGAMARTVREQTHAALEDMRGLIGQLRSGPAETSPSTMRGIGGLLSELRAGGVRITAYVLIEAPDRATAQLDSAVHRIVQESLTNAVKHAPSALIDVFVQVLPDAGARIRIENAVRAGAPTAVPGGGHGALGIRERAIALGGTAWIGEHEGLFIVDVSLPWQEREPASLSSTGEHR